MNSQPCIVCGSSSFAPFWRVLKKCTQCGHCVADLEPETLDFGQIYDESYFAGDEYEDYLRDHEVFIRQFEDRLRQVRRYASGGELIEIGCAYGFFLEAARRHFEVRGFDICCGPVAYAREKIKVDARCENFSETCVPESSADVVVMWDTIEHLPHPDLTVQAAARALRPGGYLFATTGDIGSRLARFQKEKWRMIHPPTHLHYFSKESIRELFRKVGLEPVDVKYVGTRRSLGQVAFSLFQLNRPKPSRIYNLVVRSGLGRWSFVLNTFDIMLAVGRKR